MGSPARRRQPQQRGASPPGDSSPWIERELRVLRTMCEDNRRACSSGKGQQQVRACHCRVISRLCCAHWSAPLMPSVVAHAALFS